MTHPKPYSSRFADALGLSEMECVQPTYNLKPFVSSISNSEWTELLSRTRVGAKKKGREFTLTHLQLQELTRRTQDCCAVTGIPFSLAAVTGSLRRPFAPSIDRIDCSKGYTFDNVRLVCVAVNVALSDWGEGVLYQLSEAMVKKYTGKNPPSVVVTQKKKPNAPKQPAMVYNEAAIQAMRAAVDGLESKARSPS